MSRSLIITADDFGADLAVNEAVEIGHREGVLTAASLMVAAPAAVDAVARAKANPGLRVGLHLVLVEGQPSLPPERVPHLVDASGAFRENMAAAGAMMFFHPAARRELAAEINAQFQAFAATGLTLDHVNTHKHFHLHPTIAGLMLKIGARYGLKAARVPVEPHAVIAGIEPGDPHAASLVFDLCAAMVRRRFRAAGMMIPDRVFGVAWSGAMTAERIAALIETLPPGLTEIYLHPATRGGYPGSASGYRYAEELAALTAPQVAATVRRVGAVLGGFGDFAPAHQSESV